MQQSHYGVGDNLLRQMAGEAQTLYRMHWVYLIPWGLLIRSFSRPRPIVPYPLRSDLDQHHLSPANDELAHARRETSSLGEPIFTSSILPPKT